MRHFFAILLLVPTALACSSSDETPESTGISELELSVFKSCDLEYECSFAPATPLERAISHRDAGLRLTLLKTTDGCNAAHVAMRRDGSVSYTEGAPEATGRWRIENEQLVVCSDRDGCARCRMINLPSVGGESAGKSCTGSAWSCQAGVPPNCSQQRGCYAGWHVRYDGSLQAECKGSAQPCSDMSSEQECAKQAGCRWQ